MWFAADEFKGDFEIFNSQKDASAWCKERIESLKDDSGWREEQDMNSIIYGEVKSKATIQNKITRDDFERSHPGEDWPDDDWQYTCAYSMLPVNDCVVTGCCPLCEGDNKNCKC